MCVISEHDTELREHKVLSILNIGVTRQIKGIYSEEKRIFGQLVDEKHRMLAIHTCSSWLTI